MSVHVVPESVFMMGQNMQWWRLLGIEWRLVTEQQLDRQVADNLDWLSDSKRGNKMEDVTGHVPENAREMILEILSPREYIWEELVSSAAKTLASDEIATAHLLRAMVWERFIEIDLSVPIQREGLIRIERINTELNKESLYGTHS